MLNTCNPSIRGIFKSHSSSWNGSASRSEDRKSTRLNSSHLGSSYAVFCLKKSDFTHGISNEKSLDPSDSGAWSHGQGAIQSVRLRVLFFYLQGRPQRPPSFPSPGFFG